MHNKNSEVCRALLSHANIEVSSDSLDIYPARVCNRCYLSLKKTRDDNGGMTDIPSWLPHTEPCPLCLRCAVGGRPRKRKPEESPSNLENIKRVKLFLRVVNSLELPQADDSLDASQFLPSPILHHLSCKVCCCVSFQLIELPTCRHFLCKPCLVSACKEGEVVSPCNTTPLQEDQLSIPSQLTSELLECLLVRCTMGCMEVMEFKDLAGHLTSGCTSTTLPSPSHISAQQLLDIDIQNAPSMMATNMIGRLVDKTLPASGPFTLKAPTGKVCLWCQMDYLDNLFSDSHSQ